MKCPQLHKPILLLFIMFGITLFADYKTLSGDVSDTLKASEGPYLVTSIINVPSGESLIIEAGTILLFKAFTGIQIHGRLITNGQGSNPVVFTSENDKKFVQTSKIDAAAYDWDGVTFDESSMGSKMRHTIMQYSLYGINALTNNIELDSCIFLENGKSNFAVNGVKIPTGKSHFSFATTKTPLAIPSSDTNTIQTSTTIVGTTNPVPLVKNQKSTSAGKVVVRILGGVGVIGGATLFAYEYLSYKKSLDLFNIVNDPNNSSNTGTDLEKAARWNAANSKKNQDLIGAVSGFALALLSLCGFSLTFFF